MMWWIPNDVEQILSGLPLDSLMRFRRICKHWKFLIESRCFADCYHNRRGIEESSSYNSNEQIVLVISNKHVYRVDLKKIVGRSLYIKDHCTSKNKCSLPKPKPEVYFPTGLKGSCNGLLFFVNWRRRIFTLYNSSTGSQRRIPYPQLERECYPVTGFGYDYRTYDYKIVCMFQYWTMSVDDQDMRRHQVDVYSFRRKSWETLECYPYEDLLQSLIICRDWYNYSGIFLSTALHWVVLKRGGPHTILRYDLCSGKFSLLPLHSGMERPGLMELKVLDGCLAAWFTGDVGVEIWILKNYGEEECCWSKMFTLGITGRVMLIALSKDRSKLLLDNSTFLGQNRRLCWYDDKSNLIWEAQVQTCDKEMVYHVEASLRNKLTPYF